MKKVLGLDLGIASIGWALVNEAQDESEESIIIKLGVRVIQYDTFSVIDKSGNVKESKNPIEDFSGGKGLSPNASRTKKRGARRNLHRFKLRRKMLIKTLKEEGIFSNKTLIAEEGEGSTHSLLELRAKAAEDKIPLEDFGRVLLSINKKRGYKSNRKANTEEKGEVVDSLGIAKLLKKNNWTPGQFVHQRLEEGKSSIPEFYRSDLRNEFDRIWRNQATKYPQIFSNHHRKELEGKNKKDTADYFRSKMGITRAEFKGEKQEKLAEQYKWRAKAAVEAVEPDITAEILVELNNQINSSSDYLGKIGDRSKILAFNNYTVGQYLNKQIQINPNTRLKNQVFYRQDYEDEFDKIWDTQAKFYPKQLTKELKERIKEVIIFFQRPLKSQKGLISTCEFESEVKEINVNGKTRKQQMGPRVAPKSSPVFQEFKVWQVLNNVEIMVEGDSPRRLTIEEKEKLYDALCQSEKLTTTEVTKILGVRRGGLEITNYDQLDGNITKAKIFEAFNQIVDAAGHDTVKIKKKSASEVRKAFSEIFKMLGIDERITTFDSSRTGKDWAKQPYYELWHLLYSYVGDKSRTGSASLIEKLQEKYGFDEEGAKILSKVTFDNDYGSLSAKAMRKILPHLRKGLEYSKACEMAGYKHSDYLTRQEQKDRVLKDYLDPIKKNSLRNPVVEKILNQMVNVVNEIIKTYGKPDEVRVELARELKKSAGEREEMTKAINKAKRDHEKYRKKIKEEFGLPYVSRNDLIKYKLYMELAENVFSTLYLNKEIDRGKLFSKDIDIEHIIPKAKLFDDSFANKTLEYRKENLEKGDMTAYDYVASKGDIMLEQYVARVNSMKNLSPQKKKLLLTSEKDIPEDFLARDLRNSQYIAKKALGMLTEVFRTVIPTTGKITQTLREDWQIVDVLKELNWPKYDKLGMTYFVENKNGQKLSRIKEWDKRNDHRHHAMDALAVAFTSRGHIQYLNNLNAESAEGWSIPRLRKKLMFKNKFGKWSFKPPMPIKKFRQEAKDHLSRILVSNKAKNKVTTPNVNRIQTKNGVKEVIQSTPRGQLHKETIYGTNKRYQTKENVRVDSSFDRETIMKVAKKSYRNALLKRLDEFDGSPKKAFTGKNSLSKNPVYVDEYRSSKVPERVKLVWQETIFTVRKEVNGDLNVKKVIDPKVREILKKRLEEFGGDPKKAFADIEDNPIWYNKDEGIPIKRVKITGVSNAIPIHDQRNHRGEKMMDESGKTGDAAFVSTGNNHHIAIYKDEEGNLYEEPVSFFEAVVRKNRGLPIVNPIFENGAPLLFTMKQNEYFVFPNKETGFDPKAIDLMDPENYQEISPNLFRVQKISSLKYGNSIVRDFVFRHHLETNVENDKQLKGITWESIKNLTDLQYLQKIRLNHLGEIVYVGEY